MLLQFDSLKKHSFLLCCSISFAFYCPSVRFPFFTLSCYTSLSFSPSQFLKVLLTSSTKGLVYRMRRMREPWGRKDQTSKTMKSKRTGKREEEAYFLSLFFPQTVLFFSPYVLHVKSLQLLDLNFLLHFSQCIVILVLVAQVFCLFFLLDYSFSPPDHFLQSKKRERETSFWSSQKDWRKRETKLPRRENEQDLERDHQHDKEKNRRERLGSWSLSSSCSFLYSCS